MFKETLTAAVSALTRRLSQPAPSDPATSKGNLTTTRNADKAEMLDDAALDGVVGGTHTGGRFMLDVAGHNVGFMKPPPPPPTDKSSR